MAIVLRLVKGSELTHSELDGNFTDLNTVKAPLASPTFTGIVKLAGVKGTASAKAANYTIAAADSGTLIVCTAALTLTFPVITTLAPNANDFFAIDVHNDSSGTVTLTGATSTTLAAGEIATVYARNDGKMIVAKGAPVTAIR